VCYADQENEDAYTARFRAVANVWRPVFGLSSDELAQQICRDEIDVLVDLMGHTGNRLPVFAQRPAAVQVTWFGDVGTTGLDVIDFLLADRFHVRPGEEEFYIETVLRLPHGYACYGPPADAPEAGPLPALAAKEGDREQGTGDRGQRRSLARRAGVTFGCFNNPAKYTPSTLDAWAAILCGVPDSRLLLKYRVLDLPSVQQRLYAQFAQRGVPQEQVVLEGWSSHRELLAAYNRVDLALDTQPYSGGVTTCEALWMGVPVITYPGRTFAGRHAVSHLTNAGYGQFVAADAAGYVELAVRWAQRLPELAAIRARMREQVRQSPLCDAGGFARDLLAVLRQAWLMADRSRRGKTDCSGKSATGP
jgi:protein O-GlcNAc transferase